MKELFYEDKEYKTNCFSYLKFYISAFSFWGMFYIISLFIGFGVNVNDIVLIYLGFAKSLKLLCTYWILSMPIFIISTINDLKEHRKNLSLGIISNYFFEIISVPYRGLDLRNLFHKEKGNMRLYNTRIFVVRFTKMIIWWVILYETVICINGNSFNSILNKLNKLDFNEFICRVYIILGIIILLNIVNIIALKKLKNNKTGMRGL